MLTFSVKNKFLTFTSQSFDIWWHFFHRIIFVAEVCGQSKKTFEDKVEHGTVLSFEGIWIWGPHMLIGRDQTLANEIIQDGVIHKSSHSTISHFMRLISYNLWAWLLTLHLRIKSRGWEPSFLASNITSSSIKIIHHFYKIDFKFWEHIFLHIVCEIYFYRWWHSWDWLVTQLRLTYDSAVTYLSAT